MLETKHKKVNATSKDYESLAMKVCGILQIRVSSDEKPESLLYKIDKWIKNMPYFSSTQKEIIELATEILDEIRKKAGVDEISDKIKKLDEKVSFDRDFD